MQRIKEFLQGKKTYISAAALCLVAICGFLFGYLGGTEATALLSTAAALAGLGAKSQRTADAIMTELRQVQEAAARGQKIDPKAFASDLSKQLMSLFAAGGIVRSTPAGAVSNVVPLDAGTSQVCIYCGQSIYGNNTVCIDPRNTSAPDTVGNRHHAWLVPVAVNGGTAK